MSVNMPSGSEYRSALNLKDNPGNLGKLLKIKGNVTRYVALSGIKDPSGYKLESGGDTPEPPTPSGSTIYASLSSDANGWNMNEPQSPAGLDRVWMWDGDFNCLKGTAFNGQIYAADVTCESPVIDLTGVSDPSLAFSYVFNNYKLNGNMISLDAFKGYAYVMVKEDGASAWSELVDMKAPAFAWNPWNDANYSLKAYAGKKIRIGFRYVSTADVAGTWEVKNLKVTGSK